MAITPATFGPRDSENAAGLDAVDCSAMRLFVGIPLSNEVCTQLTELAGRIAPTVQGWRWSAPESWHITLQFLGNATPEKYARLTSHLSAIRAEPVLIRLGQLDLFDRVGIFFADVEVSPQLAALQQMVVAAAALSGFVAEARPYHPHITLARAKERARDRSLPNPRDRVPARPRFSSFAAQEFLLYESLLGPAGARYEVRARFPLA
jgi:2'-5' RNA ligase